jgi:hypothetical protein
VRGCVAAAIPPSLRASHTHPWMAMRASHTHTQMSLRARRTHSRMGRSWSHRMAPKTKMLVSGCFAEVRSALASLNISALGVIFGPVPVPVFCNISCALATRYVRRLVSSFRCCCGPINRFLEAIGADRYKTYRIYREQLPC